ncbi:NAD-dependent succinate-semialdehyde dehydrogenase [Cellvibrio sp. PSBB023]|uniref:NAD-dependent succinate-semialdehyde dehydrogenase n=1 Tax=Cellvibrio sp. PSBB023 TaxID=1945512 RepID=UPI00098F1C15|nr:NAD-dependent succinate-semialdehyde dehydrogenase [Cellvibrio sp. PSBB023]AQT59908.1 succinate-semialdehyde dehydrogenase (NADP(+)) [Cellvibrio sp. PSBB023]
MKLVNQSLLRTQAFINGDWCSAASHRTFAVENPATGEHIAQVACLEASDARRAIQAGAAAQGPWAQITAKERSYLLRRWFDLVMKHQTDLAHILTAEQGKPLAEAKAEVAYGASYIEWFAEEAKRINGDIIPPSSSNQRITVFKQPVGVVAAITPWNFPNAMLARKLAPALAAGCSVVAKPAAETPLSALALAYLAQEAGIPAGVINIVTSSDAPAIGAEFTSNPTVRKISFTGSTAVGKLLIQQCAADVKRITLELGGNAPFIVFEDADLDAAVAGAMASKFRNAGQTCVCANRFYIQRDIYQAFTTKLIAAMRELRVGNGMDSGVSVGPLISHKAIQKAQSLVDDAIAKGAQRAYQSPLTVTAGHFYPPTLLTHVPTDAALAEQEIFGPVAALIPFADERDAIALANNSVYGLAAYCYTRDRQRIKRVGDELQVGMLGMNTGLISNEMAPFGGIKQSGWGREGSSYGIDDYVNIKYINEFF